ncbi:MAG: hypothetical protein AAGD13_24580 [Pseudomonadota bacterium]
MSNGSILISAACLSATLALAACYQVPQSTAASYEKGTIAASAQAAGSSIVVDSVGMPSTGWVVVHEMDGDAPVVPASIGNVYVPAGPSSAVRVPLSKSIASGQRVMAMLHLDTGVAKVYEFGNDAVEQHDKPVLRDGKPVAVVIDLN